MQFIPKALNNWFCIFVKKNRDISVRIFLTDIRMYVWVYVCMCVCARLRILWDFEFFENVFGNSNFRKIWAIVLKLQINIIHRSRIFGIEFGQNRLERSNFLRFLIFRKFSLNFLTCANFELISLKFVYECTNTKWSLIRNFVRIGRGL